MPFRPSPHTRLVIREKEYVICEHPAAPGMAYGQSGRRATVYQVQKGAEFHALKVFTRAFKTEQIRLGAQRIRTFASLPGLQVCARIVLDSAADARLLSQHPDLEFSVLMPWVQGQTWQEMILSHQPLTADQSMTLARSLASVLARMEQSGIAHCDLSGPNVLICGEEVALVDVEDLYAPGLEKPDKLPGGSAGYGHKTASGGLWSADADRFAGAVLIAEILGWCDERIRRISVGEQFFDPGELQENCDRFTLLKDVIGQRFGHRLAEALIQAWFSRSLQDCPRLEAWLAILSAGPAAENLGAGAENHHLSDAARYLLDSFKAKIAENNWSEAEKLVNALQVLAPNLHEPAQLLEQARKNADAENAKKEERARLERERAERQTAIQTLREKMEALQKEISAHEQADAELAQKLAALDGKPLPTAAAEPDPIPNTPPVAAARPVLPASGRKSAKLIMRDFYEHTGFLGYVEVEDGMFLPGSKRFITFAADKKARVWDFDQSGSRPQEEIRLASRPRFAAKHARNHWVAMGSETGQVVIWDTSKKIREIHAFEMAGEVTALVFSPSGKQIVVGCSEGVPSVFSTQDLSFESDLPGLNGVDALEFSPDGKYLAGGLSDGNIQILDAQDFSVVAEAKVGNAPSLVFDSSSRFLCCGDGDGMITLYDLPHLNVLRSFSPIQSRWINRVVISPENDLIASSTEDGDIYLWRTSDGKLLDSVTEHKSLIFGLDFHASGKILLSTSYDGRAILWDIK